MVNLSDNLHRLKRGKGVTNGQIAEEIGTSETMISNYITGRSIPPLEVIVRLATYFGVSLDTLILGGAVNGLALGATTELKKILERLASLEASVEKISVAGAA